MVFAENASSWADIPALASIIWSATLDGLLGAAADLLLAEVDAALVQPELAAFLDLAQQLGPDRVDQRDARADDDLRARGWGTGRRSTARR